MPAVLELVRARLEVEPSLKIRDPLVVAGLELCSIRVRRIVLHLDPLRQKELQEHLQKKQGPDGHPVATGQKFHLGLDLLTVQYALDGLVLHGEDAPSQERELYTAIAQPLHDAPDVGLNRLGGVSNLLHHHSQGVEPLVDARLELRVRPAGSLLLHQALARKGHHTRPR